MARKEISMENPEEKTFEKLSQEHQRYCKINNLSPVTMASYQNASRYFIKFIGTNYPCKKIRQQTVDDYKLHLFDTGISAVSVNSYVHNLSPIIKFGMERGSIKDVIQFRQVKAQEKIKDIYTDDELKVLLKKPDVRKRGFAEYRNWVIINTLVATGMRANELRNLKVLDTDLANDIIKLQVTKNNKARMIPISTALKSVLTEYLAIRNGNPNDYLFPNIYGEMMPRTTLQMTITKYCKKRGIEKYSLHLFRHCFATNYLRAGGNPLTLQRILGHSTLKMVNRYIQMNTKDLQQDIDKFIDKSPYTVNTALEIQRIEGETGSEKEDIATGNNDDIA